MRRYKATSALLAGKWDSGQCNYLPMKLDLVRIGNSRGIRIPKPLIEQCGFGDSVELYAENERLFIARRRYPRQGWKEAFAAAGSSAHDPLLLESLPPNEFDAKEWTW
jgi:antitoxin MazE